MGIIMPIVGGTAPGTITINVLGGFSAHRAERIFTLPLGAQRLLSYVALASRPVTRMELSGALWPDSTQRQASANLRTALWRIGQAFGKGRLDTADGKLCLAGQATVDIRDVSPVCQHLVTQHLVTHLVTTGGGTTGGGTTGGGTTGGVGAGREPAGPGEPDFDRLAGLDEPFRFGVQAGDPGIPAGTYAVDGGTVTRLCQRLLPGWHDDWLIIEQERWDQLRLHALEAASQLFSTRSNHVLAIEAALICAREEPLRESAHRAVISAYLAEGNLGAALKHYYAFKEFLYRELGVAPTASMDTLVRPLLVPTRTSRPAPQAR
jgi:DNA-binding SARP family transcriptional activator